MTNGTAPPPARPQGPGLTIRVYTVASNGRVTSDRGTRIVPLDAHPLPTVNLGTQYPPCRCPRHNLAGAR
ncbi:hypothetical protein KMT30_04845 [Streptomyces sp. IBSBF 2953]|nr:hypothetical protein [Streptomyces hayashii]